MRRRRHLTSSSTLLFFFIRFPLRGGSNVRSRNRILNMVTSFYIVYGECMIFVFLFFITTSVFSVVWCVTIQEIITFFYFYSTFSDSMVFHFFFAFLLRRARVCFLLYGVFCLPYIQKIDTFYT